MARTSAARPSTEADREPRDLHACHIYMNIYRLLTVLVLYQGGSTGGCGCDSLLGCVRGHQGVDNREQPRDEGVLRVKPPHHLREQILGLV